MSSAKTRHINLCKNYNIELVGLQDKFKWKKLKEKSLYLADIYKELGIINKFVRCKDCGSDLLFKDYGEGAMKLYQANFCKIRLCPMCIKRRSLKMFGQMSKVMNHLEANQSCTYLFLTLTVENMKGEKLTDSIGELIRGFDKLRRRKEFDNSIKGWYRSLEVNYDSQSVITSRKYENAKKHYDLHGLNAGSINPNYKHYHPHFHVILAVDKSYLFDHSVYLDFYKWREMWRKSLGVNYDPVVNIQCCNTSRGNIEKAVAEIAKYTVKDTDFLLRDKEHAKEVVKTLDDALHGRRLIGYGGVFKDAVKALRLDDVENGDLVHTDLEELREDLGYQIVRYKWFGGLGNYYRVEQVEKR